MSKISSLFALSLLAFLFGCQGNESTETSAGTGEVNLVQVDSIMINIQGNLKIYDYNEETGMFLGGDIASLGMAMMPPGGPTSFNELGHVVIGKDGKVLHQFMHADDSPEGHGRGALSSFFIGKDKIGVIGLNGMFVYALDGTFLQKYKEFAAANFIGDPGHRVAAANQDGMMAVGFTKREDYTFDKDKIDSFYQLMKPFHFYKLDEKPVNKEEVKAGLIASFPYPTAEVYAPGFNMLKNQTAPQIGWNLERDQISVLYPEVPLLEHYDMKTGAFVKAVDLAPDHFKNPEEMPMSADDPEWFDWYNNGGWFANSYYRDLVEIGDYSLLRYTPAVPDSEVEMLMKTGGTYNNPEWVRIQKEHFNSYYQLFRDDEKIAPDFQIPAFEILEGQNGFGSRFGAIRGQIIGGPSLNRIFVFAPNDEDIERDYELIRVYRLAVN